MFRVVFGIAVMTTLATSAPVTRASADDGLRWAIALHGGAGRIPTDIPDDRRERYHESLRTARDRGVEILAAGGSAMDAVEAVVRALEDDELFNAGRGAVFTREGRNELDASIMDGETLAGGGVSGVTRVRNPVTAARRVMQQTSHVLIAGEGADRFAEEAGCRMEIPAYFFSITRWASLEKRLTKAGLPLPQPPPAVTINRAAPIAPADRPAAGEEVGNTVGCVALDAAGHLAAATSTGGMPGKRPGRIGDSPVLGAGTYADDRGAAVSGTGTGEEYIRHFIAGRLSLAVQGGTPLDEAARRCVEDILRPGDGGLIALDAAGRMSLRTNTGSMPRAWADSAGEAGTAIWDEAD